MWGLGCTFIVRVVHPLIYAGIQKLPKTVGIWLLVILLVVFVIDCSATVATILQFNRRIRMLDTMAENIRKISDELREEAQLSSFAQSIPQYEVQTV